MNRKAGNAQLSTRANAYDVFAHVSGFPLRARAAWDLRKVVRTLLEVFETLCFISPCVEVLEPNARRAQMCGH
jgi:hypothetical protein